jgi:hypothetical protein
MAKFRLSKKALDKLEREIEAFNKTKRPSQTKGPKLQGRAKKLTRGTRRGDYEVGYGKPPLHSRIKPGQVLNPAGRGKGKRGFKTEFREFVQKKTARMRRGDKVKKVSALEASFEVLWEKLTKGDIRAISLFHNLAERYHNEEPASSNAQSSQLDDEILSNFIERQISERAAENAGDAEEAPDDGETDEVPPVPKKKD